MPRDFWFWTAVPADSTFELGVDGTGDFVAHARVQVSQGSGAGAPTPTFLYHIDLTPVPAALDINPPRRVSVVLFIRFESQAESSVTVAASVVCPNGTRQSAPLLLDGAVNPDVGSPVALGPTIARPI